MSWAATRGASTAALLLVATASAPAAAPLSAGCNDLVKTALLPEAIASCTADLETGALQVRELAEAYRRRGVAYTRSRKFAEALGDFDLALAAEPDWPEALADKGRALVQLGGYGEAGESFRAALEINPELGRAYSGLAWIASDNNDLEGALRGYSRAFELNPKDWHALANRGITNHHLDRPVAALQDLDRAAAADPKELAVTYSAVVDSLGIDFATDIEAKRAAVLEKLGQIDEAIDTFSAILRRYPAFTFVSTELSRLLIASRGDKAGALDVLTQAARHDPTEWRVPMQIARIHAGQNDVSAARAVLAQLQPPEDEGQLASFHQGRSTVLRRLGDYDAAVSDILAGARTNQRYLASVMINMRDLGYVQDLPDVPMDQQVMNGLQACVRDFQCAYWN